jgi:uncharacterized protein involved in outer membrane biogenesis
VLPDRPWDLPSLRTMDARVAVALSQLDLGSARSAPLAPLNASLVLEDGVLSLQGFTPASRGRGLGSARLDTRPSPPQWQIGLGVRGMAVEQWLSSRLPAWPTIPGPAGCAPTWTCKAGAAARPSCWAA